MAGLRFVYDYKDSDEQRLSFHRLTREIFAFDLEEWYQRGFWNERYVPFSYFDGERAAANVSVNKMDLIMDGRKRTAIQIGTVMTHPDYRGRGLAAGLMKTVLQKFEKECDFFYLFADGPALGFYPRFGFCPFEQSRFTAEIRPTKRKGAPPEKLDILKSETLKDVYEAASLRRPVSRVFGVENAAHLVMFHCMYTHKDDLFYVGEEDMLAICRKEQGVLHIYDLISRRTFDFGRVMDRVAGPEVERIEFHFTPDLLPVKAVASPLTDDGSFARGASLKLSGAFQCPITAQA